MTTTAKNSKKNKQTTSLDESRRILLDLPECLELATVTTSCTDENWERRISTGSASCHKPRRILLNSVGVEWICRSEDTLRDLLNDGSARDYGSMGPATSVTSIGHSSPMICRSVTTFATTAVLELRGLLCLF